MRLRWLCRAPGLYIGYIHSPYGKYALFDVWQDAGWWRCKYRVDNCELGKCKTLKLCKEQANKFISVENPQR